MSSRAKFQNNSFVTHIVSSKNARGMFLSLEPFPDDFSKILLNGNQVNHGTFLCVEFHDRQNSLEKQE